LDSAEQDFISFKLNLLSEGVNDPIKKAEVIHEIVNSISVIPDLITRNVYIQKCSKTLEIEENVLNTEVARNRNKFFSADSAGNAGKPQDNTELPPNVEELPSIPAFVSNIFCQEQEKELLMYMLKHGRENLFRTNNEEGDDIIIHVDEYIIKDIKNDDLEFQNLQYKKLFEEYEKLLENIADKDSASLAQHFIQHREIEISSVAVSLLMDTQMQGNDHYTVSKIWNGTNRVEINLTQAVPRALAAYKSKVLTIAIFKLAEQLKSETGDDKQFAVLEKLMQLNEQKKIISNYLERVVL
jgi:DNA primase